MKDLTNKQIEKMFNDPKMLLWEHCNSVWFSGDEELSEEQLEEKRERNRNYIKNLSVKKLEKRKISESNRQKKRWANMSEVQKEIKRKGDRIFQKRKSEMKRKERLKNEKKDR